MTINQQVVPSEWAPLQIAAFRAIWFASLAANIGTWFQNVGGVWLMFIAHLQTRSIALPIGVTFNRKLNQAIQQLIIGQTACLP